MTITNCKMESVMDVGETNISMEMTENAIFAARIVKDATMQRGAEGVRIHTSSPIKTLVSSAQGRLIMKVVNANDAEKTVFRVLTGIDALNAVLHLCEIGKANVNAQKEPKSAEQPGSASVVPENSCITEDVRIVAPSASNAKAKLLATDVTKLSS